MSNKSLPARTLSVAPMLDWTDRHYRHMARQITHHAWLYTEMVTTGALIHGHRGRFLDFNECEHPVALQLGGSDTADLAQCAQIGLLYELNLFGVVSLAFVTAVGGGMVRDMLVNEVTQILTEGIYGTVAVLIGLAMWALDTQGLLNAWALYAIAAAGLGLRLWAIVTKKSLPKLSRHESYKN